MSRKRRVEYLWDADNIRALRQYMGLSQQQMSEALGVRQQTISEWETGMYRPRGGMCTLLTLVAEREGFSAAGLDADRPQSLADWRPQPLARLDLKPRALNALQKAGMRTVGQVLDLWQQGEEHLLDIQGFGRKSLAALEEKLREYGLIY